MPSHPVLPIGQAIRGFNDSISIFHSRSSNRVVTADPWSYFFYLMDSTGANKKKAQGFINQAHEFFTAAEKPNISSRPLLYYYSFLNLVKAGILFRGISLPIQVKHGITDSKANYLKQRFRFEGQRIQFQPLASDHSQVFPEFLKLFGVSLSSNKSYKVIDILKMIPSIHRTYCSVAAVDPCCLHISRIEARFHDNQVWMKMIINKDEKELSALIPKISQLRRFTRYFKQVNSVESNEYWWQSKPDPYPADTLNDANQYVCAQIQEINKIGTSSILTSSGYRYYLNLTPTRLLIPYLPSVYSIFFYLGSITRYRPDDFEQIIDGKYKWLIGEFMETQPIQFIYSFASYLSGVEVVKPFASIK